MSSGLAIILVLAIVIGLSMSVGENGLQQVIPALLSFIDNYLIPFLLGLAFLIFVWNAVRFFVIGGATDEGKENAKNLALYSIAAFIFILSFWGLVNILVNGLNLDNCNNQLVPDYLSDEYTSYAPCTSPRPQPRPDNLVPRSPVNNDPIEVTPLPPLPSQPQNAPLPPITEPIAI